ncbi:glycosyl hydrolase family 28-related protein [Mycobacterium sp. 134]|uniref:glycosyl hydrolase family 28-related protein n=1 Tax=Mycobacterium sp. 134 TaxID=3400425 RepID=UPI003AABF98A
MSVIDVTSHGATGDGTTDDYAAVMSAVREATDAGGGTVFFPAGEYALSDSIGNGDDGFAHICLLGAGERAARLRVTADVAPISGRWIECRIENLKIDANSQGSPGFDVDLDKSYVRHCWIAGWTDYGMRLNTNTEGLLNWIDDNFIEQATGYGIYTTYRFFDSWIVNNNIGSTGPNLSIEAGPVRILANHLDGAPKNNIELRGNKQMTIIGNICEGARREAIVFTMPSWLESDDEQIAIVGNNITNGGKGAPVNIRRSGSIRSTPNTGPRGSTSPAITSPTPTRGQAGAMRWTPSTSMTSRSPETSGTTTDTVSLRFGLRAATSASRAIHRVTGRRHSAW